MLCLFCLMDDEKIINMDLSALSEVQQVFYHGLQQEIISLHLGSDNIEIVDLVLICGI
jgi:hypothetical protein